MLYILKMSPQVSTVYVCGFLLSGQTKYKWIVGLSITLKVVTIGGVGILGMLLKSERTGEELWTVEDFELFSKTDRCTETLSIHARCG